MSLFGSSAPTGTTSLPSLFGPSSSVTSSSNTQQGAFSFGTSQFSSPSPFGLTQTAPGTASLFPSAPAPAPALAPSPSTQSPSDQKLIEIMQVLKKYDSNPAIMDIISKLPAYFSQDLSKYKFQCDTWNIVSRPANITDEQWELVKNQYPKTPAAANVLASSNNSSSNAVAVGVTLKGFGELESRSSKQKVQIENFVDQVSKLQQSLKSLSMSTSQSNLKLSTLKNDSIKLQSKLLQVAGKIDAVLAKHILVHEKSNEGVLYHKIQDLQNDAAVKFNISNRLQALINAYEQQQLHHPVSNDVSGSINGVQTSDSSAKVAFSKDEMAIIENQLDNLRRGIQQLLELMQKDARNIAIMQKEFES
jgi:Nucleoporin complex subunit 54